MAVQRPLLVVACLLVLAVAASAQRRPGCVCATLFEPVCGSNGVDYPSACEADCSGVAVASRGYCPTAQAQGPSPPPGRPPRGGGGSGAGAKQAQVPAGEECLCTRQYNPVCGADGTTYPNECQANCAGVAVASSAECGSTPIAVAALAAPAPAPAPEPEPVPTPVLSDLEQLPRPPAPAGGATQLPGAAPAPGDCLCAAVFDPVCGANGVNYPNGCEARCAGTTVASKGNCPAAGTGGAGAGCLCPFVYAPVCTAAGTRSNECVAACAGETTLYEGECTPAGAVPPKPAVTTPAVPPKPAVTTPAAATKPAVATPAEPAVAGTTAELPATALTPAVPRPAPGAAGSPTLAPAAGTTAALSAERPAEVAPPGTVVRSSAVEVRAGAAILAGCVAAVTALLL